jgi:hypothetical protein
VAAHPSMSTDVSSPLNPGWTVFPFQQSIDQSVNFFLENVSDNG